MLVAYIAGPFTAKTTWELKKNIMLAEEAGLAVSKMGIMPLIPHSNTGSFFGEGDEKFWYDGTMELLERSDIVVLIPGWGSSKGARNESARAILKKIPIVIYGDGGAKFQDDLMNVAMSLEE